MKRVKFNRTVNGYARGSVVSLSDEAAAKAIKVGDASESEQPESVGAAPKQSPHKRVIFNRAFKHGKGDSEVTYPKDARMWVPAVVAEAAIKQGAAKEFPVQTVGEAVPVNNVLAGAKA